jgi:hypothetical protein
MGFIVNYDPLLIRVCPVIDGKGYWRLCWMKTVCVGGNGVYV